MNLIKRLGWPGVFKLVLLFLAGVIALRVYYWLDYQRNRALGEDTPEYYALHGVKPGQVNELQIGDYRFRFPAENFPEPYTGADLASDIVKGKADRATVHLDVSEWAGLPPAEHRNRGRNVISVQIQATQVSEAEYEKRLTDYMQSQPWTSITDLPEPGLKRFHDASGGWGYLTYMAINSGVKDWSSSKPIFSCTGSQSFEPSECRSAFIYSEKVHILYYFSGEFLPRWQEVDKKVLKLVDSTLIETKEK